MQEITAGSKPIFNRRRKRTESAHVSNNLKDASPATDYTKPLAVSVKYSSDVKQYSYLGLYFNNLFELIEPLLFYYMTSISIDIHMEGG